MPALTKLFGFLASYTLALTILAFMFIVTLCGTLAQGYMGLLDAQRMYFESWWIVQPVFGQFHLPLPGGITLMSLLSINLICGGILRLRKDWRRAGILVGHLGIAVMMLAGLVKFTASEEGLLALYEGEAASVYVDAHRLELAIYEPRGDGMVREFLVSDDVIRDLRAGESLRFHHPELPFELALHHYVPSAVVARKGPMFEVDVPVVDGCYLRREPVEANSNLRVIPGWYATAHVAGREPQQGILWGLDSAPALVIDPWTVEVGGRQFGVTVRQETRKLPFRLHVDDFTAEFHPGTGVAKAYFSDVRVFDGDAELPLRIEMNEPLRLHDFILFQSSWGPQNRPDAKRLFTVFSVVTNPSDHWPLYSCIIIGIGLLFHFTWMLIRYISAERRARAAEAV